MMKLEIISIPLPGFSRIPEDFLGMFFPFYRGFYIFLMGFQHVHGGAVRNMGTHRDETRPAGFVHWPVGGQGCGPRMGQTCMGE
jgi:hypothetical protein